MFKRLKRKRQRNHEYMDSETFTRHMEAVIGVENMNLLEYHGIHLFHRSLQWFVQMGLEMEDPYFSVLEEQAREETASIIGRSLTEQLIRQNVLMVKISQDYIEKES